MKSQKLKITYRDPQTGELKTHVDTFHDTPNITAREWAEDLAYSIADKGYYEIKEVK